MMKPWQKLWRYPKQDHYSGFILKSGLTLNLLEDIRDCLNTEGITNFHFLTLSQCEQTPDHYDDKKIDFLLSRGTSVDS